MTTWVLAGIILTGAWTQLDETGIAAWLVVIAVAALDRSTAPRIPIARRRQPASGGPIIIGAILCGLILAHVALTATEEFGFGGDEGYHLSATRAFALYYLSAGPLLAAVLALFAFWRWRGWPHAGSVAMAGLLAGSFFLPLNPLFGRYPTGVYHLVTPLAAAFEAAGIPYPFTANHIVNALSVPAWLFLLRPLLIGRWPDWQVLPVALLIYFQPPALTYVSSALLEPWAFVFLLLALEALVALDREDRWIAIPAAATAACFKETAILLLPAVWVAASVEWQAARPSLRRGAVALGAACVIPFLVYYAVRRGLQVERSFELASAADIWTRARAAEWITNVRAQLGVGGMLTIAAAIALAAAVRQWIWILTALLIMLFFFGDAASVPYTGYGRFAAYALLAVCGGVFAFTYAPSTRRAALIGVTMLIAALQAIPFARTFALDFGPDYERNSMEWRGSLVRLPVRSLTGRISELRDGDPVRQLRIVSFGPELISVPVAYPDLAARYTLVLDQQDAATPNCGCRDDAEGVLAGFEWPAHFGDVPANRSAFEHVSAVCVQQLTTTCRSTIVEKHSSGAIVGALGAGKMTLIALPQHDQGAKR